MTNSRNPRDLVREPCRVYELFERIFEKLHEDLTEAYFRTPNIISSKPYIARALNLTRSSLSLAQQLVAQCRGEKPKLKENVSRERQV